MNSSRQDAFLVRTWAEPRENGAGDSPRRFYVRHLATGEEWYLASETALTGLLTGPSFSMSSRSRDAEAGSAAIADRSCRC